VPRTPYIGKLRQSKNGHQHRNQIPTLRPAGRCWWCWCVLVSEVATWQPRSLLFVNFFRYSVFSKTSSSSSSSSYHIHNHNGFSTSFRLFSLENCTSIRCSHRSLQWPALLLRQDPGMKKQFPNDMEKHELIAIFYRLSRSASLSSSLRRLSRSRSSASEYLQMTIESAELTSVQGLRQQGCW